MKRILLLLLSFFLLSFSFKNSVEIDVPIQYDTVEVKPMYPGGISEFMNFVMSNYKIPEEEEDGFGVTGVLEGSFVIGVDGKVSQITILKNVGAAGNQIKKIIEKSPVWKPGKDKGVFVPVLYNFTVTIK